MKMSPFSLTASTSIMMLVKDEAATPCSMSLSDEMNIFDVSSLKDRHTTRCELCLAGKPEGDGGYRRFAIIHH